LGIINLLNTKLSEVKKDMTICVMALSIMFVLGIGIPNVFAADIASLITLGNENITITITPSPSPAPSPTLTPTPTPPIPFNNTSTPLLEPILTGSHAYVGLEVLDKPVFLIFSFYIISR
jgi:hypothetical protein